MKNLKHRKTQRNIHKTPGKFSNQLHSNSKVQDARQQYTTPLPFYGIGGVERLGTGTGKKDKHFYVFADEQKLVKVGPFSSVLLQERFQVSVFKKFEDHHVWLMIDADAQDLHLLMVERSNEVGHGALQQEMNNQIGPAVKQEWNDAMHVLHNIWGVVINTLAYHLGRYNLHLLILKSSVGRQVSGGKLA